jgi:tetratricopeptide (TPR) repeat protein
LYRECLNGIRERMRGIRSLLFVAAAAALIHACTGGGPPPETGTPQAPDKPAAKPDTITVEDHIRTARTMAENGRQADAIAYLETKAGSYPGSAALPAEAGLMLLETGDNERAVAQFRRAVAIGGHQSKRAHRELGRTLFDMERYGEAADVLAGYNDRYPGDFRVNMELGFIYFDRGSYKSALPCYRAAVETRPKSVDAKIGLARTLEQLGRTDNAIRVYHDALSERKLTREMEPVILAQSNLLNQRGRYGDTLDLLDRILFAETPGLSCARGLALAGEGNYSEAIAAFSRATADPRWSDFATEQIRRINHTRSTNR